MQREKHVESHKQHVFGWARQFDCSVSKEKQTLKLLVRKAVWFFHLMCGVQYQSKVWKHSWWACPKPSLFDWYCMWRVSLQHCETAAQCVYLYSLSCRIPTGSKPWGFWTGVMRFCLCCIGSITDTCCPGGWGVPELPGMGPAGTAEAWGGAGEGRPLATGVSCFCAIAWFSGHWPGEQTHITHVRRSK